MTGILTPFHARAYANGNALPAQKRRPAVAITAAKGGTAMRMASLAGAFAGLLLTSTALIPANAGDMTFERALNVAKEPHNWLLHHGNYEGHRFSQLKDIN